MCRAKLVYMASHVSRHFHSCTKFHWVPPLRGSCVLTASHAAAFVCAVRADAVFRLVLQTLHAGKCHLVCTHCSGPDFLAYLASAEDRRWSTISSREIHLTSYMTPCYNKTVQRDRGDVPCQNGINYWQEFADYRSIFVLMSCARCWRATTMKCASQTAAAVIARSESAAARQLRSLCTNRSRKSTL